MWNSLFHLTDHSKIFMRGLWLILILTLILRTTLVVVNTQDVWRNRSTPTERGRCEETSCIGNPSGSSKCWSVDGKLCLQEKVWRYTYHQLEKNMGETHFSCTYHCWYWEPCWCVRYFVQTVWYCKSHYESLPPVRMFLKKLFKSWTCIISNGPWNLTPNSFSNDSYWCFAFQ